MLRGKRSGPETPFGAGNGSTGNRDYFTPAQPRPRPNYGEGRTCPGCRCQLLTWEKRCPLCDQVVA